MEINYKNVLSHCNFLTICCNAKVFINDNRMFIDFFTTLTSGIKRIDVGLLALTEFDEASCLWDVARDTPKCRIRRCGPMGVTVGGVWLGIKHLCVVLNKGNGKMSTQSSAEMQLIAASTRLLIELRGLSYRWRRRWNVPLINRGLLRRNGLTYGRRGSWGRYLRHPLQPLTY